MNDLLNHLLEIKVWSGDSFGFIDTNGTLSDLSNDYEDHIDYAADWLEQNDPDEYDQVEGDPHAITQSYCQSTGDVRYYLSKDGFDIEIFGKPTRDQMRAIQEMAEQRDKFLWGLTIGENRDSGRDLKSFMEAVKSL